MNPYLLLVGECLACLAVSFLVLAVLARPLMDVLARVCPDEKAATFWLSYCKVMVTLAPLLMVLTIGLISPFSDPLAAIRLTLMASLGGLLLVLQHIGRRLGRFVVAPTFAGERP